MKDALNHLPELTREITSSPEAAERLAAWLKARAANGHKPNDETRRLLRLVPGWELVQMFYPVTPKTTAGEILKHFRNVQKDLTAGEIIL
jgi:hypothetical protein